MKPAVTGLARFPALSHGFRPFFLGAASWATLAMVLWLDVVTGAWTIARSYGPLAWHAHELLFGYVSAVVAGFLLTAIPNWTGRLPVRGGPLLALFRLWAAGRIALLAVDWIGLVVAMAVDALFLIVFALAILREIVVGRNWRNLKTVALVTLLAAANIGFHVEVYLDGAPDYSVRVAVAAILGLIMLVGGRLVPSFTRNWLVRQGAARLPASFEVAAPGSSWSGIALLAASMLQAARISRWTGLPTSREPLVFVLHGGYAFVPLGFLLVGLSVLWPQAITSSGALHAWTVGTMTLMTLAVMTRASLGHTGYPVTASITTCVVYAAAIIAAFSRIAASLLPDLTRDLLSLAAVSWLVAFGGFLISYGPKLVRAPMSS
jgi:uncharacterized protein involved in response to NO